MTATPPAIANFWSGSNRSQRCRRSERVGLVRMTFVAMRNTSAAAIKPSTRLPSIHGFWPLRTRRTRRPPWSPGCEQRERDAEHRRGTDDDGASRRPWSGSPEARPCRPGTRHALPKGARSPGTRRRGGVAASRRWPLPASDVHVDRHPAAGRTQTQSRHIAAVDASNPGRRTRGDGERPPAACARARPPAVVRKVPSWCMKLALH